jgi:DNA (cytosine-5)-methyltransferase 1
MGAGQKLSCSAFASPSSTALFYAIGACSRIGGRSKQGSSSKSCNSCAIQYAQGEYSMTSLNQSPAFRSGKSKHKFTFIDLFAGIGGLRIGLERNAGKCLFSSEWDKYCQKTYKAWFGETPHGDIKEIDPKQIPDHDVLAAGFPCQPFSIAGVSKKNSLGRAHGFLDVSQGTLFYNVATIAEIKRPPMLLLENVKNLVSHDQGKTFEVIRTTLESLNYNVFYEIIDAQHYVPQHRERIFLVCFDRKRFPDIDMFNFPKHPQEQQQLSSIFEKNPDSRYTLSDHLWNYLQQYAKKHKEMGNGFGFGLPDFKGITRTLSARYFKDGSEILISQTRKNPRRLTPRECARLMGFPDDLPIVVSDTQAYRQFGNAVVPPVAQAVAASMLKAAFSQNFKSNTLYPKANG